MNELFSDHDAHYTTKVVYSRLQDFRNSEWAKATLKS